MPPLVMPTAQIPLLLSLRYPTASHQEPATQALALMAVPACVTEIPITYLCVRTSLMASITHFFVRLGELSGKRHYYNYL